MTYNIPLSGFIIMELTASIIKHWVYFLPINIVIVNTITYKTFYLGDIFLGPLAQFYS